MSKVNPTQPAAPNTLESDVQSAPLPVKTPPPRGLVGWNPRRTLVKRPFLPTLGQPRTSGGVTVQSNAHGVPSGAQLPTGITVPNGPGTLRQGHGRYTFTLAERSELNAMFDGQHYITSEDLDRVAQILNTPAKASAFVAVYFDWVNTHTNGKTYAPLEQLRDRLGVCRDQHSFVTWVLNQNGIPAYTVAYSSPGGVHHAVPVYQREDGLWAVMDYGTTYEAAESTSTGQAAQAWATPEAAIHTVAPGAYRIRLYDVSEDPTVGAAQPVKTFESHVTLEGRRLFNPQLDYGNGVVGQMHAPHEPTRGIGANLRADMRSVSAQVDYGALSIEGRKWFNESDPMLAGADGIRADLRVMEGLTLSGGVLRLPGAHYYTAGNRYRVDAPVNAYFVGANLDWPVLDAKVGPVRFRDDVKVDANVAFGVGTKNNAYDSGTSFGLSYVDVLNRFELSAEPNAKWSIFAAANSYNPTLDIVTYFDSGGKNVGKMPVTLTADAGVRYSDMRNQVQLQYYQPVQVKTNLYSDKPKLVLSGSSKLGEHASVAASVETGFTKQDTLSAADVGLRLGPLGVSGGVQREGGQFAPRGTLSLDVVETVRMLGHH